MIPAFSPIQISLIQLLSDGNCHSGNHLGQILGVSRTAIWKNINLLISTGIPILTFPQHGYQLLYPFTLLNEQSIQEKLSQQQCQNTFHLNIFNSIDSTNRYLKELPNNKSHIEVCCAEQQTQGRGRFGRAWFSPFGENIYCSSRWELNYDMSKLSGLSLVTSLSVLATLKAFYPSPDFKVKWPNDLYWHDKKIGGCLIEIIAESNNNIQLIIGIGLNVNSNTSIHPLPDHKEWCSLHDITNQYFNRNPIIALLLFNLENYLNRFTNEGFESFLDEWNQSDYLLGKDASITQYTTSLSGTVKGIDNQGRLILQDESGKTHHLSSGDTSLKKN